METLQQSPLPLEMLMHIAMSSRGTFRQMLALRPVVDFLGQHRNYVLGKFTNIVTTPKHTKYYIGKKLHREDGPAVIYTNGTKKWYWNGKCHRDGDLPAIERVNGDKLWYRKNKYHRDSPHGDLPAIEWADGNKQWFRKGKCYRINNPAVIYANGNVLWYQDGEPITNSGCRQVWQYHTQPQSVGWL